MLSGPIPTGAYDDAKRRATTVSMDSATHHLLRRVAEVQGIRIHEALMSAVLHEAKRILTGEPEKEA